MTATDVAALLTVTVDDESTIFSGLANVHRYDQPTPADIVSYVRSVLGDNPQWAPVHLVADESTLAQLIEAFGDYEVKLSCETVPGGEVEEPADTHPATSEWEEIADIPVRRPVLEPRAERFGRSGYTLIGAVALVVLLCAAAIWFVAGRGSGEEHTEATAQAEAEAPAAAPAPPVEAEEPSEEEQTSLPEPQKVVLEQDGLRVELPAGFHLEPDGDMWRATGPDPDFRLQLAVDPLYGVAPDAVMRQVEKDIENNPDLRHTGGGDDGTSVTYEHDLPDGSHALWRTWTDRDVQISIGCHTRTAPTTVQLAACTMANESARFTPPE